MNTRDFYLEDGEAKADLVLADLVKDNLAISSKGNPYPGWTDLYGVTAYIACPTFSRSYLDYRMNKYPLSIYPTTIKLFDILGTCTLSEGLCYDHNHLSDRTSTYQSRIDILRYANEEGLDAHAEGVAEYMVPYATSFEGSLGFMQISGVHNPNTMMIDTHGIANEAERVPLWQLVYHECAGTFWHWEFGDLTNINSGEYCDLYSLLYGEKGMFLPFYSNSGVTTEYFDLMIERMQKLNQVFLDVATEEMTNHEFLTSDGMLQRTTFASGVTVTVNFSKETTHSYGGYTYAPYAWKATGTTSSEQSKEIGTAIKNTHEKRIATIDFEDADNLYWDSAFWTYADSAAVTAVNPISGKKSLLINNEDIDFKSLITLNTSKFPLKNKNQYRFSFTYKIDSATDIDSMQLVLGSGKYVRFNLSTLGIYEGTSELVNSTKLVRQADGSVKVTIIFDAGEYDSMRLEGGIYKTGNPLKIMLDDISIEEIYEFNVYEEFKGLSSITDTVFLTDMATQTVNADSISLSNPKATFITVLGNDTDKFTLAADTYYELEFTYKLPSPTSMTVMQLKLSGGRYVQFYCYSAYSYGANTLPNTTFTKNSNGTITVKTSFKTDASGADTSFELIGGINQYYAMNIELLDFKIKPPSANVDFEALTDLGNTFYKSDAEAVTIDSNSLISGEKSLLLQNSKADFVNLFYTSERFPYLSDGNTYQLSFTYKITSAADLGQMQLVLGSGRYVRFDCTTRKVTEGNQDIIDNTYFTRNSDGSVTVKVVFTCNGRDSQYGFKLQGGVLQESDIKLILDDICLYETVNFLGFDTENGIAMLSFEKVDGITEIGAGVVAKTGTTTVTGTKKVSYINPEAESSKYFAIKDKTVYYGDLNDDGVMNSLDIASMRKLLIDVASYNESCDSNIDKNFDIRDLIRYKKLIAEDCIGSNAYSDKYLYPVAIDSVIWMKGDADIILTPYYFVGNIKVYCKKINLEYSK